MAMGTISVTLFYFAFCGYAISFIVSLVKQERVAGILFTVAFVVHTISQLLRGWYIGMFFPNPIFNEVPFLPWCLAFVGVLIRYYRKEVKLSILLAPVLVFAVLALLWPKGILPPFPKNQTIFSPTFFATEVMAHACFY